MGDCDWRCEYCNASFWYGERLKGSSTKQKPRYNRCCAGGNIRIEQEVDPPDAIKQLFKDKHFLENIRAYNQMFSMTSFGAEIDDSVNNGRGPYVFKISGQIYHWIGRFVQWITKTRVSCNFTYTIQKMKLTTE